MFKSSNKHKTSHFILNMILIVLGFITIFPFIWMFFSSFKHNPEIVSVEQNILPREWTFDNYVLIQERFDFMRFFFNSLFIAVAQTTLVMYMSAMCGYVLSKYKFKLRKKIFGFVLGSMMVPWTVTIIPRYFIFDAVGLLDSYWALILPVIMSGFGIFLMKQSIGSIPTEVIEAARADGAGEFFIFHKIILPMSKNALSSLAIFQFLWSWEDFLWPYLVINSTDKQLLPVGLRMFDGQYGTNYGGLFAATTISILPVIIVYIIFQRRFIKGVAASAVKG